MVKNAKISPNLVLLCFYLVDERFHNLFSLMYFFQSGHNPKNGNAEKNLIIFVLDLKTKLKVSTFLHVL